MQQKLYRLILATAAVVAIAAAARAADAGMRVKAEETAIDWPKAGAKTAWGSGCFVSPLRVLTAFHVVDTLGARLFVEVAGEWRACRLVKHDKAQDLALLELLDGSNAAVNVIELAVEETMTVSGSDKARPVTQKEVLRAGGVALGIVTDGNSGGPLLNARGKLTGMITANIPAGEMKMLTGGHPAVMYVGAETIREFLARK